MRTEKENRAKSAVPPPASRPNQTKRTAMVINNDGPPTSCTTTIEVGDQPDALHEDDNADISNDGLPSLADDRPVGLAENGNVGTRRRRADRMGNVGDSASLASACDDDRMQIDPEEVRDPNEKDKDTEVYRLQEDIFNLLFTAPMKSEAFFYAVIIFLLQIALLFLIFTDLLANSTPTNKLGIPPAVSAVVSASQVFALIIAVFTQDEVISTIYLVCVGYDKDKVPSNATYFRWVLSNTCRFLEGGTVLVVSFIFIIQSDEVLELFMNFAGMAFVSELDNIAFALAKKGFITDTLQEECRRLEAVQFATTDDNIRLVPVSVKCAWLWKCYKGNRARRIIADIIVAILLVAWGYFFSLQSSGEYMCNDILVLFGDETFYNKDRTLHYAHFSGMYEIEIREKIGGRPVYYEGGKHNSGKFFYCEEERSWVFAIAGVIEDATGCQWLLRSPEETKSFDLSEVTSSGWEIWTGAGVIAQSSPSSFQLRCSECNSRADCNFHGACINGRCQCVEGWLGRACEFQSQCDDLTFEKADHYHLECSSFSLLRDSIGNPLLVHARPVYFCDVDSGLGVDSYMHLLVYTGNRWYWVESSKNNALQELMGNTFHSHWSNVYNNGTILFSDPTERNMPVGEINWNLVGSSRAVGDYGPFGYTRALPLSSFHCKQVDCTIPHVCGLENSCVNGTCDCTEGYFGHFCQFSSFDLAPT